MCGWKAVGRPEMNSAAEIQERSYGVRQVESDAKQRILPSRLPWASGRWMGSRRLQTCVFGVQNLTNKVSGN